jgi:cell division protein FtsB
MRVRRHDAESRAGRRDQKPAAAEAARPDREGRARRIGSKWWIGVAAALVLGVLLLGVLPARTWLNQRADLNRAEQRLQVLNDANSKLDARVAALQTPEEVERVAREQYHMKKPGEQAFSLLPAPPAGGLPAGWPFQLVNGVLHAHS